MHGLPSGLAGHGRALPIGPSDALPDGAAVAGVEGDDARVGLPAHHDDEQAVLENGGAADAEKGLRHLEIRRRVALPDQLARPQIQADQLSFRAKRIAAIGREQGRGARAVVVSEGINKMARVRETPERLPGGGGQAFHHLLIAEAMVEHESLAQD